MFLLNITNRAQIHELYKKVNRENFYFSTPEFSNLGLISGMEVKIKYKISAQYLYTYECWTKKHRELGSE